MLFRSLDALRQRFGRLNRNGRDITPSAAIVAVNEEVGARSTDRVYGEADACAACTRIRAQSGRSDELCDDHLGDALGMGGGWALGAAGHKLDRKR